MYLLGRLFHVKKTFSQLFYQTSSFAYSWISWSEFSGELGASRYCVFMFFIS